MVEGLVDRLVGVLVLGVFADHGDADLVLRVPQHVQDLLRLVSITAMQQTERLASDNGVADPGPNFVPHRVIDTVFGPRAAAADLAHRIADRQRVHLGYAARNAGRNLDLRHVRRKKEPRIVANTNVAALQLDIELEAF